MLSFAQKYYELPLSRDYVRHWGLVEGVREILQNALDSDSPFEYSLDGDTLAVRSRYAVLMPNTLLLGRTSKAEDADKIGSFGEGYKIALLVLTREGYPVVIRNGDRVWTPEFRHNKQFDAETLCIVDSAASDRREGVTFEISGLSSADIERIRDSCLHMQDKTGEVVETSYGRILLDVPGRLYVGGLFVCETELKYSYDMKPEHLRLERDRQTVSSFDLNFLTKDMWFDTGRTEEIVSLITNDAPDMKYANYSTPQIVKEECYRIFKEQNPGAIVAASRDELALMLKKGMTNTVYIGGAYGEIVKGSTEYRQQTYIRITPPAEVLQKFFDANRRHMRTPAVMGLKRIIAAAANWKA